MRRRVFLRVSLLFFFLAFVPSFTNQGFAQNEGKSNSSFELPPKEKFKIALLAGQSNMAGRGVVENEDRLPIPRVYMLNQKGEWVPAVDPIHYDKSSAGVGPGREFARLLAESDPSIAVGLVPAACGGSSIDDWRPSVFFKQTNSYPYDDAIARTKRALIDGTLVAILWRQGESDASVEKAATYGKKLQQLFRDLRAEFGASDIPILVGELYITQSDETGAEAIRKSQIDAVEHAQPAAFVSAVGTTLNPDNIHFDRKSQIEQGKRFFEAYQALTKHNNSLN